MTKTKSNNDSWRPVSWATFWTAVRKSNPSLGVFWNQSLPHLLAQEKPQNVKLLQDALYPPGGGFNETLLGKVPQARGVVGGLIQFYLRKARMNLTWLLCLLGGPISLATCVPLEIGKLSDRGTECRSLPPTHQWRVGLMTSGNKFAVVS